MGGATTTPATLQLPPELLENIRSLSFDGLKALPRRGAEIGGLITAALSAPSLGDDLLLVKCEYLFGPSYHLSSNDIPRLLDAVQNCRSGGKFVSAFFRSCTREKVELDREDLNAISQCCPDVPFAVLARPSLNGSARISVFSHGAEDTWPVIDDFTIPSPRKNTAEQRAEIVPPAIPFTPPEPPAPDPQKFREERERRAPVVDPFSRPQNRGIPQPGTELRDAPPWRRKSFLWLLYPSVLCILAIAGYEFMLRLPASVAVAKPLPNTAAPKSSKNSSLGLGLAVRDEGGTLHLTWDRASDAAKSATAGVLEIDDGSYPSTIGLRPTDVTEGSLAYTPHTSDITFRLRILNSSGNYVSEVIRALGGPHARQIEPAKLPAPVSGQRTERSQPAPVRPKTLVVSPVSSKPYQPEQRPAKAPEVIAAAHTVAPPSTSSVTPQLSDKAPPVSSEKTRSEPPSPEAARPPVASPQQSPSVAADAGTKRDVIPSEPAHPVPSTTAPPITVQSSPSRAGLVAPPQPLRQVNPNSAAVPWHVPSTVKIVIRVGINAEGNVTNATAEQSGKNKNLYLVGMCLSAARQWTFRPARLNGKPVASEYRIEFVFSPK